MGMMRIRAVWTTNLAAFLLGAGMYASFIIFPQFAQFADEHRLRFGASVVQSGLYLLPSTLGMVVVGFSAGWIASRFGSKQAVIVGSARSPLRRSGSSRSSTPTRTTC
jgi:MFS family permease